MFTNVVVSPLEEAVPSITNPKPGDQASFDVTVQGPAPLLG
jgi:hypothetical protein